MKITRILIINIGHNPPGIWLCDKGKVSGEFLHSKEFTDELQVKIHCEAFTKLNGKQTAFMPVQTESLEEHPTKSASILGLNGKN